jgi:hypothetical protein
VKRVIVTKEERLEKKKNYYYQHKEENTEKCKKYREEHKEHKKEYDIKYKQEHKEEISEKRKKETFTCNCGSVCRKSDKNRHERSLKHQNFITDKNKTELLYKLEEERIELLNKILELSNNDN